VAAEGQALATGQLDAAYLDPVTAVRLWQDSRGTRLTVVAGAASGRTGEDDSAVLVFTRALLTDRPAQARGLLEGDVQAVAELDGDPAVARTAVGQELTALGALVPVKTLAEEFTQVSFSNDPMAGAVLAQARQAAAAGQLKPVTSLAGLYDLGPLNVLLKGAGQRQVST
jgi:NitT/TauT family transport system substrate-binding protein